MKQEVKKCGENTECLDKVSSEIQKDITTLPARITNSGDEVMMNVFKLKTDADDCCQNAYGTLQTDGTNIYDGIVECINSKF